MEQQLQIAIELEAVKVMAQTLLRSEQKELELIYQFQTPNLSLPYQEGVYPYLPGRYCLRTPDGIAEIFPGDFVLKTTTGDFYFLRMEKVE